MPGGGDILCTACSVALRVEPWKLALLAPLAAELGRYLSGSSLHIAIGSRGKLLMRDKPSSRRWWVLLAIGVGTFMSALDGSVVNTILPVMRTALHSDVAAVEWVVTVYLLVVSGVLLSFGRLGDLRGHKRTYVTGFGIFVVGSALCGIAPTAAALIAFRAFQALGAAMLFANSPAILTKNFPAAQRGQALGMQATMTYLGLSTGPALGGWLAGSLGWRSVFYINVPVGLVALALSLRFIPDDPGAEHAERFDMPGAQHS